MMRVWLNGRLIDRQEACVPVTDRGLLLSDGLFETMAVHNCKVFDLDAHLERLASGLVILGFAHAVDLLALRASIERYVGAEAQSDAVLRLTVTRGSGPRGLAPPEAPRPTILMTLSPMPSGPRGPVALHVASATRRNEHSPLSRVKALSYADHLIALSEARAYGADDALLLNTRGTIACATAANVFVIRAGRLETPPICDGALPGTMRALVLSLAKQAGLTPIEKSIEPGGLAKADAAFLTNSISRVIEITRCNGSPVGSGAEAACARLRNLINLRFEAQ